MNNIKKIIDKYNLIVRGISNYKNITIINTNKGKYVIKKEDSDNNIYNYLESRDFNYILRNNIIDNYSISEYIDEIDIPREEKAIELINIMSLLHNKTIFYREVDTLKVKDMYEDINNRINYLDNYYRKIHDQIEEEVFPSPGEYLLLINFSLLYKALSFSKENLNKWYEIKKKKEKERVVLLHNNLSTNHLLIGNQTRLISWHDSKRDVPIYDFINFYKNEFMYLEMNTLFDMYQEKFFFTDDEYYLFLTLISLPEQLEFNKSNYLNCRNAYKLINYLKKTDRFILNENKKAQQEEKDNFNEENNSM